MIRTILGAAAAMAVWGTSFGAAASENASFYFVCPEALPSDKSREFHADAYVSWLAAQNPPATSERDIASARISELKINHCDQTLAVMGIKNDTPPQTHVSTTKDAYESGMRMSACIEYRDLARQIMDRKLKGRPLDETTHWIEALASRRPEETRSTMLHIVGAAYKEGEFYGSTVAQFGNYSFNACMAGHTF